MKPNTNYGLRVPSHDEIRHAFGSLAACVRVTGGDTPTILYYLANQDRIEGAPDVPLASGQFASELIDAAHEESAQAAWNGMEKPSITKVADQIGVCKQVARRALVSAGKWPKAASA